MHTVRDARQRQKHLRDNGLPFKYINDIITTTVHSVLTTTSLDVILTSTFISPSTSTLLSARLRRVCTLVVFLFDLDTYLRGLHTHFGYAHHYCTMASIVLGEHLYHYLHYTSPTEGDCTRLLSVRNSPMCFYDVTTTKRLYIFGLSLRRSISSVGTMYIGKSLLYSARNDNS